MVVLQLLLRDRVEMNNNDDNGVKDKPITLQPTENRLKKPAIATIFNWNQGISFPRELGNNQIKELPPGVFNNNTELISLYVTCLFW